MSRLLDRVLPSIAKNPTLGVIGISSWDTILRVDRMPDLGGSAVVVSSLELPGGSSSNAAAAAAALGARVELFSAVGNDAYGVQLIDALESAGIDCAQVTVDPATATDRTTIVSTSVPQDRVTFWKMGAMPRRGHRINIDRLFAKELVILDSIDPYLRRFLIDLPVHTYPNVKIMVPLKFVVDFPGEDELESVVRCDALVGSKGELQQLTATRSLEESIAAMQARMRMANLRSVAITLGRRGAIAFDSARIYRTNAIDVDAVDTTGAGDAFAGAFGVAYASRLELPDALEVANCVAGLSTRAAGAQSSLPSLDEVAATLTARSIPERG